VRGVRGRWSPGRRGTITGPQQTYLRRLLNQAFGELANLDYRLDANHLGDLSMNEASAGIDMVKRCIERNRAERERLKGEPTFGSETLDRSREIARSS
jgi:hypothetical protein